MRMCLPARRGRVRIRKRADVTPAAFVGTFCAVAPLLIDRDSKGEIKKGFAPGLGKVFGIGAFDFKEDRFEGLLLDQSQRLGVALGRCWGLMQDEVITAQGGDPILKGPLSVSASRAGWTADGDFISKIQKDPRFCAWTPLS